MTDPLTSISADILYKLLLENPFQNKRGIQSKLEDFGYEGITTSQINRILYNRSDLFDNGGESLPVWFALPGKHIVESREPKSSFPVSEYYIGHEPRAWQLEAFEAWTKAGKRGIIEAVTGTGKTTLGILAATDAASRGLKTVIIVPSIDLQQQWFTKLQQSTRGLRLGRFGGSFNDTPQDNDITITTVQTACKYQLLTEGTNGFLIADEVHRYGTETFQLALEEIFNERMGLTATYERDDNGLENYLNPYFLPAKKQNKKHVVFRCSYVRGLSDNILANFRLGLIPVEFEQKDFDMYAEFDNKIKKARKRLIEYHQCPDEPFGEFIKQVTLLSRGGNANKYATIDARNYLGAFTKRRALLAETARKLTTVLKLKKSIQKSNGALIFTETIKSSQKIASALKKNGLSAQDFTSDLNKKERKQRLDAFQKGAIKVLIAPKVLDEGIDVPEADVGIIVSASRSKRQMIQRMGRIIRPKADGHPATFFILYVKGTYEDPDLGAHGTFLGEIMDTADEIHYFPTPVTHHSIAKWFNGNQKIAEPLPY